MGKGGGEGISRRQREQEYKPRFCLRQGSAQRCLHEVEDRVVAIWPVRGFERRGLRARLGENDKGKRRGAEDFKGFGEQKPYLVVCRLSSREVLVEDTDPESKEGAAQSGKRGGEEGAGGGRAEGRQEAGRGGDWKGQGRQEGGDGV
eukprot:755212-Hanusia_phi.AAC.2